MKAKVTINKITITRKRGRGAKQKAIKNGKIVEVDAYTQEFDHLKKQNEALDARIAKFENTIFRRVWRYLNKPIKLGRK